MLRKVYTDHDPPTCTSNTQAAGAATVTADRFWWPCYNMADPRVILQYGNEEDIFPDGEFYLGLMKRAEELGRKVVIFNDSVGATEDDGWLGRRAALEYCRDHGHFVGLHAYGRVDAWFHPLTALDNPGDWRWYGGRFEHLYSLMPDVQPRLLLTECGPGKSEIQLFQGPDEFNRDRKEMEARADGYLYLKSFNWWTCGSYMPDKGEAIDSFLYSI